MKIEKAGLLLDIQDLTIFNRQKLKRYLDVFHCCLDWICVNPPGSCAVDLRYSHRNRSKKIGVRFFTFESSSLCSLIPSDAQVYKLHTNHRSEEIYFVFSLMWAEESKKDWSLSIDWRAQQPGGMPSVPLEDIVDLNAFGLELCDRFYIMERQ